MSKNRKVVVGAFVLGGVLLFAVGLFWIGNRRLLFSKNITLTAQFQNLSGLKVGARVLVSGMDAGEVLETRVPGRPGAKFRVDFRVLDKFQPMLRTDSIAAIQMEGLVGSKVLQVEGGTEQGAPVRSGSTIQSREATEISDVLDLTVETIRKAGNAVDEVQGRVVNAVDIVADVGEQTRKIVVDVGADIDDVLVTGKKVATNVNAVVEGVREGRGTAGRLFNDEALYKDIRGTVGQLQNTAENARKTSEDVRAIVADLQSRNIGENTEKTLANLRDVSARAKDALGGLLPPGGRGAGAPGPMEEIRATLSNTREATADLADNMEALKRNWFFRGFFRSRGFYDLNAVSLEDYRGGKVAPERDRERAWLHRNEIFTVDPKGGEILSEEGRAALDKALAPYLRYAPNTPLMIEGYSGEGDQTEQFLRSRDRAQLVRRYILNRFGLNPKYVGSMPMGGVSASGVGAKLWDGVAVVYFPEKQSSKK
ncbi:MAG TPA: MlaD family protein [Bryobacteraceae bacterium]|nr:MlaD family protein [Bryobacteraceae bacterium]